MINPPPGFVVAFHDQAPPLKLLELLLNSARSPLNPSESDKSVSKA